MFAKPKSPGRPARPPSRSTLGVDPFTSTPVFGTSSVPRGVPPISRNGLRGAFSEPNGESNNGSSSAAQEFLAEPTSPAEEFSAALEAPSESGSAAGSAYTEAVDMNTVDSLLAQEDRKLLDTIDDLQRTYGISEITSLPQLVCCGDQSSGKSSVLEAITDIPFPRRDNLCTRFATHIVLRRSPISTGEVRIIPDSSAIRLPGGPTIERLNEFKREVKDLADLEAIIDQAAIVMGIGSSAFSSDVLSVEIKGPTRPDITLVDLPGLVHTPSRGQTIADIRIVSDQVKKYMADERTIILAVVSAKNDIANQVVLKRATEVDPEGQRTMGILTKPDTLPEGSPSEEEFIRLASNQTSPFRFKLGWHILRNRTYEERSASSLERHRTEKEFFNRGAWRVLPKGNVGIDTLRGRVSAELRKQIAKELPGITREINVQLIHCDEELKKLGERRITPDEQRQFLTRISTDFERICRDAVEGHYDDSFFVDTGNDADDKLKRIRWGVMEENENFANNMAKNGHTKEVMDGAPSHPRDHGLEMISREEALEWVSSVRRRNRGRELPGTFNPLVIGSLFIEQSVHWQLIAELHLNLIKEACQGFLKLLIRYLTSSEFAETLLERLVIPSMDKINEAAEKEFGSLLRDRLRKPITYDNHSEKIEADAVLRWRAKLDRISLYVDPNSEVEVVAGREFIRNVIQTIPLETAKDADEQALDHLLSFYDRARRTFVDNIAIQVIERHILDVSDGMPAILSSVRVAKMPNEELAFLVAETQEERNQRLSLEDKRRLLQEAKGKLARVR